MSACPSPTQVLHNSSDDEFGTAFVPGGKVLTLYGMKIFVPEIPEVSPNHSHRTRSNSTMSSQGMDTSDDDEAIIDWNELSDRYTPESRKKKASRKKRSFSRAHFVAHSGAGTGAVDKPDQGKECANCFTNYSPQWRHGWIPAGSHERVDLCNRCGLRYKKGLNCMYCNRVYLVSQGNNGNAGEYVDDGTEWMGCSGCRTYTHVHCAESVFGATPGDVNSFLYFCPSCVDSGRARRANATNRTVYPPVVDNHALMHHR